jgi:hypothetical protein
MGPSGVYGPLRVRQAARSARSSGGVELAVTRAVEEALPLVPVEYEHPLIRIARYPHQDPVGVVRGAGRS